MTQDNEVSETFAQRRFWTPRAIAAAVGISSLIGIGLVALAVPKQRQLIVSLALATVCAVALAWIGRLLAPMRINKPHAEMLSIIQGIALAGASFALLICASTLYDTADWRRAAGSTVVYLLMALFGAAMTAAVSILCYWPVHVVLGRWFRLDLPTQGATIGVLAGLIVSGPLVYGVYPYLIPAAALLCGLYGYRAATLYEQLRRQPAAEPAAKER